MLNTKFLNGWIKKFSKLIDFNKALIKGEYLKVLNLINCGHTWQGSKIGFYSSRFKLPEDPIQFTGMIKIILDLGLMDSNEDEDEPFCFYFLCENMDKVILEYLQEPIYESYKNAILENKRDYNSISISKFQGKYVMRLTIYDAPEEDIILNIEKDKIFQIVSNLSKFDYTWD